MEKELQERLMDNFDKKTLKMSVNLLKNQCQKWLECLSMSLEMARMSK